MGIPRKDINYISPAGNANPQNFNLTLVDNYRTMHIKSLWSTVQTAGVSIILQVNGKQKCKVDTARFAAGNDPVEVEFDLPNNQTLVAITQDLAGSSHSNMGIQIGYEVDTDI